MLGKIIKGRRRNGVDECDVRLVAEQRSGLLEEEDSRLGAGVVDWEEQEAKRAASGTRKADLRGIKRYPGTSDLQSSNRNYKKDNTRRTFLDRTG